MINSNLIYSGGILLTTKLSIQQRFEALDLWHKVGFQFVKAENGYAEIHLPFKKEIENTSGTLHGGIIMMALDNVMGMATMSVGFDNVLTIQMETRFIRQGDEGIQKITGQVIEKTRSTVIVEGRIHNPAGELVALCTATFKGIIEK